jgi:pilus assembly protein Flp/PilA
MPAAIGPRARPDLKSTANKSDRHTLDCEILAIRFGSWQRFVPQNYVVTGKNLSKERAQMFQAFKRFAADESGATSIEYGLICAGIAVALIAIINSLGENLIVLLSKLLTAV